MSEVMNVYLFSLPDGKVYNVQEGLFVEVGTLPVTVEMFNTFGNSDLNLDLLKATPFVTVHFYTTNDAVYDIELQAMAVYTGKTVVQIDDFVVPSISAIIVKMYTSLPANALLKFLISPDLGVTWYTQSDNKWIAVVLADIATEGLSIDALIGLSKNKLQELIPTNGTLRIAYYLEQSTSVDKILIERTRVNYDLKQ